MGRVSQSFIVQCPCSAIRRVRHRRLLVLEVREASIFGCRISDSRPVDCHTPASRADRVTPFLRLMRNRRRAPAPRRSHAGRQQFGPRSDRSSAGGDETFAVSALHPVVEHRPGERPCDHQPPQSSSGPPRFSEAHIHPRTRAENVSATRCWSRTSLSLDGRAAGQPGRGRRPGMDNRQQISQPISRAR
jgi:hypothetical protein